VADGVPGLASMTEHDEADSPVAEGDVLADKYRVERVLGIGGMGVVVAARHLQLDRRVALKFLLPVALRSAEIATRFAREARTAAKIQSEHVARINDTGTLASGAPYMVMEYLDGSDLCELLRKDGALPVEVAVNYVLEASEAIAEAHQLGIVHRDLKPANLFLAAQPDGSHIIKVLDFGISKLTCAETADAVVTLTTDVFGTPSYMSPEQLKSSGDVDGRTDIWALGTILFELVTGHSPFPAGSLPEICAAVLQGAPERLTEGRPHLPAALEAVIDRCLEKKPEGRFGSIAELARALAPHGSPACNQSLAMISRWQPSESSMVRSGLLSPPEVAAVSIPPLIVGTGSTPSATKIAWGEAAIGTRPQRRKWMVLAAVGTFCFGALGARLFLNGSRAGALEGHLATSAATTADGEADVSPGPTEEPNASADPAPVPPALVLPATPAPASVLGPTEALPVGSASAKGPFAPPLPTWWAGPGRPPNGIKPGALPTAHATAEPADLYAPSRTARAASPPGQPAPQASAQAAPPPTAQPSAQPAPPPTAKASAQPAPPPTAKASAQPTPPPTAKASAQPAPPPTAPPVSP
jgi:eukaryotic-like serine/threonine-protein kinase